MTDKDTQIAINKAYCFDSGLTQARVDDAWEAALRPDDAGGNRIVRQFSEHGMGSGLELPNHLLIDLLKRYPE
jgi:hypothetical protein